MMIQKLADRYRNLPIQVRAALWFFVCSFLQKGISFVTTPIFTRLLSPTEYGLFSVYLSWYNIFSAVVTLNLSYGFYVRGLVKYDNERAIFSSSLQGLTTVLVLAWTAIYLVFRGPINPYLGFTTLQMLLMFLMIWCSSAFRFWTAEQRVDFRYRVMVLITLAVSVAKPALGIVLVMTSDDKVTARILGLAIVEVIGYTGFFVYQMARGRKFVDRKFWKRAILFSVPLVPHYLSTTILNSADRIMIEKMVGASSAGIYSLAYSIAMIMTMVNTALMSTIEPWLYKKIKEKRIESIARVAYPTMLVIAAANLFLIAFAPEAVELFAPPSYHEAIYVMPPVAMSVFFMFTYTFFAVFEFYYKKTGMVAIATTGGAVLNIVLNYVFIDVFGYQAAGYTTLFCYLAYALFHFHFMRKICQEELDGERPFNYRAVLMISVSFMVVGFVFLASYDHPLVRYALLLALLLACVALRKRILKAAKDLLSLRYEQ